VITEATTDYRLTTNSVTSRRSEAGMNGVPTRQIIGDPGQK